MALEDSAIEDSWRIERIRYPEIDTLSASTSSRQEEIAEEPLASDVVEDKIFVAVGKIVKESRSTLVWALQNSRGKKICIIHVHQPSQTIPILGGKFPVSSVGKQEVRAYRETERQAMFKVLDEYVCICAQAGVRAEKLYIEMDSIEKGIVELISQQRIGKLVMGAAPDSKYSKKMKAPKSTKAIYVQRQAPAFCHIWYICKGDLIYTRVGIKQSSQNTESIQPTSLKLQMTRSQSNQPDIEHPLDEGFYRKSSSINIGGCSYDSSGWSTTRDAEASSDGYYSPLRESDSQSSGLYPRSETERSVTDHLYYQLKQAMVEAENLRREAFEESMKRRKAEKDTIEAIRKAKAAERLYSDELRQREEIEGELARGMEELESIKNQRDNIFEELQNALGQRSLLQSEIEKSNLMVKELEEKLVSAVELLQNYKRERQDLQIERDNALHAAEELRGQLERQPFNSQIPKFFSEFSFSEIEIATNNFDPSLKIGEGGYGNIYKGFLRHTEVAIKIPHHDSLQGPQEFQQEVDILSKLRHPNLVTLIGACPETWTIIYEYLPNGSLEDRLSCKDNTPPLSWQTRIVIAAELCSVLIYLHSSKPNSIVHGDLKPANVLLDAHFACKLSDFGISKEISNGDVSMGDTTRFYRTEQPMGTFAYMDPEILSTGELTTKSDVYSFGVMLLRLLTGKPARGIAKEVQYALDKDNLNAVLDTSAGDWPFVQAKQLACLALRCCETDRSNRPDLMPDVSRVLEPMRASCGSLSSLCLRANGHDPVPSYFICPIFQEIMEDPQIAADGYTYEAEALRGWLDGKHDTSPMTNLPLAHQNLIPNRALRSAIQEWLHQRR
ncbi:hypothetical protein Nepgr_023557 [Nepenthes gracilis]|uniref:RING-type E3 ubiquitin transferase n=1 Tax=Nepenthes gracilis TaxID=150966 RepID=A0AAD3T2N7_NEPGR|nr:hypothetical protein Nepgr_023557 [Nepenthes gracilis]